jgi:hypothetical protein
MTVASKPSARGRKSSGPRIGYAAAWIDVAPLSDEEWCRIVNAFGPDASLDYARVYKRGTLRENFDFVIDFSANVLMSDNAGPTARELVTEMRRAAQAIESLAVVSPVARNWLNESVGEDLMASLAAVGGRAPALIAAQASAIESGNLILSGDTVSIDVLLVAILEIMVDAGVNASLPSRGDQTREPHQYPAFNLARLIIEFVHDRVTQHAPAPADLRRLREAKDATLLDRLYKARQRFRGLLRRG